MNKMNIGAYKNKNGNISFLISSKNENFENVKYIVKRPFTEDILMQPDYLARL